MHKQHGRIGDAKGGNAWMLTFADLLSLLLTFFVMLFAMNSVQVGNWEAVVETMSRQFNPQKVGVSDVQEETNSDRVQENRVLNLTYLEGLLREGLQEAPDLEGWEIRHGGDRLILSLPAAALFEDKSERFKGEAIRGLKSLAGTFARLGNRLYVAAHTNPLPVETGAHISNWELSLARSRKIAGTLAENGYKAPITVLGFADTRFYELDDNVDLADRYGMAERTDIIILDKGHRDGQYDIF